MWTEAEEQKLQKLGMTKAQVEAIANNVYGTDGHNAYGVVMQILQGAVDTDNVTINKSKSDSGWTQAYSEISFLLIQIRDTPKDIYISLEDVVASVMDKYVIQPEIRDLILNGHTLYDSNKIDPLQDVNREKTILALKEVLKELKEACV